MIAQNVTIDTDLVPTLALELAGHGFPVYPGNSRHNWSGTVDPQQVRGMWFHDDPGAPVYIDVSKRRSGGGLPLALLAVRPEEGGRDTLAKLGLDDPDTATALTRNGVELIFYRNPHEGGPAYGRDLGPGLDLVTDAHVSTEGLQWTKPHKHVEDLPEYLFTVVPVPDPEKDYSRGALQRVSISAEEAKPPAILVPGLFYREAVHVWEAEPGTGKSIAALAVAAKLIRDGKRVVYFDVENGPKLVAERMASIGATDGELEAGFFYYPWPELDAQTFEQVVELVDPALVVFDNLAAILADAGINENDNSAVTGWYNAYPKRVKAAGRAALIMDHVTKRDGESRGASAKLAEVEVRFSVRQTREFNRRKAGEVRFKLRKDRPAALPERVPTYAIGGSPFVWRPVKALTDNQRTALETLEEGATSVEWLEASGLSKATFYRIIKDLKDAELVTEEDGRHYLAD